MDMQLVETETADRTAQFSRLRDRADLAADLGCQVPPEGAGRHADRSHHRG